MGADPVLELINATLVKDDAVILDRLNLTISGRPSSFRAGQQKGPA